MLGSRRTKDFQAISGCMLLQNCGDQNFSGNANQLASQLSSAANTAKEKGYTFNQQETSLLIELLKQNMSPEEQKKADRILQLIRTFRPKM